MTAPTLRQHIVSNVLPRDLLNYEVRNTVADVILASPELAAIIDLAAWADNQTLAPSRYEDSPVANVPHALLESWRASRAEQKPER